jgi:hypothetical protein
MVFEHWWRDLRLAWRGLCRARGFTGSAVLTPAVGIAGTTVMFALVEGVLLRPLPVREQDRLVVAWIERREVGATHWPLPVREIDVIARESQILERVAGVGHTGADPVVAIENGSASYIRSTSVTGDFFGVLGVEPLLGRALGRADGGRRGERARDEPRALAAPVWRLARGDRAQADAARSAVHHRGRHAARHGVPARRRSVDDRGRGCVDTHEPGLPG